MIAGKEAATPLSGEAVNDKNYGEAGRLVEAGQGAWLTHGGGTTKANHGVDCIAHLFVDHDEANDGDGSSNDGDHGNKADEKEVFGNDRSGAEVLIAGADAIPVLGPTTVGNEDPIEAVDGNKKESHGGSGSGARSAGLKAIPGPEEDDVCVNSGEYDGGRRKCDEDEDGNAASNFRVGIFFFLNWGRFLVGRTQAPGIFSFCLLLVQFRAGRGIFGISIGRGCQGNDDEGDESKEKGHQHRADIESERGLLNERNGVVGSSLRHWMGRRGQVGIDGSSGSRFGICGVNPLDLYSLDPVSESLGPK